jgi:N-methylhydantoinase A/oxoprolinase/acetone carboxylase beta subunit/N-methylhydantoinase B/oxoprolinase/acetone carboxylase alpha subunit
MSSYVLGVDVGGTFTDLLLIDSATQQRTVAKVATTPANQANGFMHGIESLGIEPSEIETLVHGTTIGTNAILERRGVRCGLITTRGFRDSLELGRRTRPHAWGLSGSFEPLVSRDLRVEVSERMDADGNVVEPLVESEVREAVAALLSQGAEAVVIHFVHAYINASHEERCREIVESLWPNEYISIGSEIIREIREFERVSTATLNGYIQPIMARYLDTLSEDLRQRDFGHDLLVMQGNGGMMAAAFASRQPVQTVMSGPAAGAIAAAHIASRAGYPQVISCDMGGTSFDLSVIRDGKPVITTEKDMMYSVPLRVPLVDIHTIGAGGGSIARLNDGGMLEVGPQSAGADPGPICYGRGGQQVTVTDANVVLGRIDPQAIAGEHAIVAIGAVQAALVEQIGAPLGLDAQAAASAVIAVANNQMANAARMVSVEKGHDPRDFALFAFGGAGPLHAVDIARELGVPKVLVPRYPGITSALGCTLADVRHDFVQTLHKPLSDVSSVRADEIFALQAQRGRELIASEGVQVAGIDLICEADLLYKGQSHIFRVPVNAPGFDSAKVLTQFETLYRVRFDIVLPEMTAMLISLRTTVVGKRDQPTFEMEPTDRTLDSALVEERPVFFDSAWHDTQIYQREHLPRGAKLAGPAIVQQFDTTILIEPDCSAVVDAADNLVINVPARESAAVDVSAGIDPVTLAVIQNGLTGIASEMDLVHQKTSFSPVISEAYDRSNGIYDKDTGHIIAQGELGLPIFLGVMQATTEAVIQHRKDLHPGDVIIVNDPYFGGTHLMDVKMVKPFYYQGRLWAYLSNTGHWPDTGGMVPGGFNSTATEIQQEGLRLPPVKLVDGGEIVQDIVDIILHNIRVPEERIGDIRAQVGALSVGEKRLTELLDRYSEETVLAVIAELEERSERMMRARLTAVPDGSYEFEAHLDSDGVVDELLRVAVRVTIDGGSAHFNMAGSSPPCLGPLNSVWGTTLASVYVAVKHLFPEVPINSGCFRPITVDKPHGTFLYAEYPRPVAGCAAETTQRIIEAVFGAFGKAKPEWAFAGPAGTSGNFSLGGFDPASGRPYIMYMFSGGGYGGWWAGDGVTNGCSTVGISKTQPIEVLEQHYPILFEEYALREGSAGPGLNRGGFGVNYRVRMLRGSGKASFLMEHGRTGPFGMLGGGPGGMNEITVNTNGETAQLPHVSKGEGYVMKTGDWVQVRTPGGGGYGPPTERGRELVQRDVTRGYLTAEQALEEYGPFD